MQQFFCVNGPLDGEMIALEVDREIYEFPLIDENKTVIKSMRYRKETLDYKDKTFVILVHGELPSSLIAVIARIEASLV